MSGTGTGGAGMPWANGAGLRARLRDGPCLGSVWLALGGAALAEIAARSGPDVLVLDLQHGLFDRLSMEAAIGAARPVPVLGRVAENSPRAIGEALDAGAAGVVVPLVESAGAAADAVAATQYPPRGIRSAGGLRPLGDLPAYLAAAQGVIASVMVETVAGVEQAGAIAAVPGIDMVFIGTGDLALSLGCAPGDPAHDAACEAVRAACAAAGTPCGIFTTSLASARARRARGYAMVVTATDMDLAMRGFPAAAAGFAEDA